MESFVISVLAALCVAGIVAAFRSHWLYLVVPKLSMYGNFGKENVTVITLVNGGLRTEEAIEIHIRPALKFDILAASRSDVRKDGSKICIPRISRIQNISILVMFDEVKFDCRPSGIERKGWQNC